MVVRNAFQIGTLVIMLCFVYQSCQVCSIAVNVEKLHDAKHGIVMGRPSGDCDDAVVCLLVGVFS